jgi:hypothetical protein
MVDEDDDDDDVVLRLMICFVKCDVLLIGFVDLLIRCLSFKCNVKSESKGVRKQHLVTLVDLVIFLCENKYFAQRNLQVPLVEAFLQSKKITTHGHLGSVL